MDHLLHQELAVFFLSLGVLLFLARFLGEVAMRFRQPAILGEILAGVLLGPTILGNISPDLQSFLFPAQGSLAVTLHGLTMLAISLFLLVAGMEVDLSTVWRQGKASVIISFFGFIIPFSLGFLAGWFFPVFLGAENSGDRLIFALFMGTALSITALPVIAKTMMDLNLFRSDLGMLIIAAAIVNDLIGWVIFSIILGMMRGEASTSVGLSHTILGTLIFVVFILTIGRWLLNRFLPWLQAHTSWPGGILGFGLSCALLCSGLTESIGIHAIFGSFLFGVALGDSPHLRERTRATIEQFVSFFFAPLFFASIGLKVNFLTHFNVWLVLTVLLIVTAGKVFGCFWGARLSGLTKRESWAVGFGMNASGAMGIILGLLALQEGVIHEQTFVAIVVMAVVTSATSGISMQFFLKGEKKAAFTQFLSNKNFRPKLEAQGRWSTIQELAKAICEGGPLSADTIAQEVWRREDIVSTGLENNVAIPHARIRNLPASIVAVGISEEGIDFDSPDGQLAKLIFLILTPEDEHTLQLEIISDIARTFQSEKMVEKALRAKSFTEFLAVIKTDAQEHA